MEERLPKLGGLRAASQKELIELQHPHVEKQVGKNLHMALSERFDRPFVQNETRAAVRDPHSPSLKTMEK